jgi:hypothetical protein
MAPAWRRALARSFATILLLGGARLALAQEEPLPDFVGVGGADLASGQLYFQCNGSPTCVGEFAIVKQDAGCSTPIGFAGTIQITVPDISVAGPVSGSGTLVANWDWEHLADGTCVPSEGPTTTSTISFSGTSDGYTAQVTYTVTGDGKVHQVAGTLVRPSLTPPSSPPPFQLTVDKNITPTTANATAQIQPPAADIGKTVSVYVFAFAPRSLVKSAAALARKDDAGGCELAQYDPQTGELRSASSSSLTAAFTGTLTAQGQSVTILNNASTPSVAGATFFVGYGSDAQTMIGQGINANAVQVPGAQQCPAVFPKLPGVLSGLWYAGAQESGWGIDFTQRENHIFAAFYTYDSAGQPKWYFASDCRMPAPSLTSGTCTGDLYELTATPLFGVGSGGSHNPVTAAGTLSVNFADPSHATMSYTVGSVSRTVPIERQLFAGGTTAPTIDYTDLWFAGEASSGWGMAISHQYNKMFLAWFVYDASGKPTWYTVSDCSVAANGNGCSGDVYKVTGPPFGPTFDPGQVHVTTVGSASVTFTDPNNGIFNYTVNGTSGSKALTRQVF